MEPRHQHIDHVVRAAQSAVGPAKCRVVASWRRSLVKHGLEPGMQHRRSRLDAAALKHRRAALGGLLSIAAPQLDQLFHLVGQSGCSVLLTDAQGLILEQRCSHADAAAFRSWGLWQGSTWSEAEEGTNGIGTCLTEERPVIIHRGEHFFARNTSMSCIDAPIFGPDGEVIGALDVSSARADQTEGMNRLIAASVLQAARQIEAETFRASFPKARFVLAGVEEGASARLLAVDADDLVVGATRAARRAFDLPTTGPFAARPACDLLEERSEDGFDKGARAAVIHALARSEGNVSEAARALGIGRATLYRRMKRLGLETRSS